jgi:imidazolonepropionase-like amidohydrolase
MIKPGHLADLVLLDANPLADIGNTRRIAGVVAAGRFLDKTELEGLRRRLLEVR